MPRPLPERVGLPVPPAPGPDPVRGRGQDGARVGPQQAHLGADVQARQRSLLGHCCPPRDQPVRGGPGQRRHGLQARARAAAVGAAPEPRLLHHQGQARAVLRRGQERRVAAHARAQEAGQRVGAAAHLVVQSRRARPARHVAGRRRVLRARRPAARCHGRRRADRHEARRGQFGRLCRAQPLRRLQLRAPADRHQGPLQLVDQDDQAAAGHRRDLLWRHRLLAAGHADQGGAVRHPGQEARCRAGRQRRQGGCFLCAPEKG